MNPTAIVRGIPQSILKPKIQQIASSLPTFLVIFTITKAPRNDDLKIKTMLPLLILLQLPLGTRNPDDNSPIDFTDPFEVIVYIILPILMIVFYVIWRRNKKRDRN